MKSIPHVSKSNYLLPLNDHLLLP